MFRLPKAHSVYIIIVIKMSVVLSITHLYIPQNLLLKTSAMIPDWNDTIYDFTVHYRYLRD